MAKVTFKFNDKRKFKKLTDRIKAELPDILRDSILKDIGGGRSPVKGKKKFVKYSDGYLKQIKKGKGVFGVKSKRPVNMTLTGEMISSFFVKLKTKSFFIGFDDPKADYHNRLGVGTGKSKVIRRLLPTIRGEKFNRSITLDMKEYLRRVAKKIFG